MYDWKTEKGKWKKECMIKRVEKEKESESKNVWLKERKKKNESESKNVLMHETKKGRKVKARMRDWKRRKRKIKWKK